MFGQDSVCRLADVRNGASNTIAFGETLHNVYNGNCAAWGYRAWVMTGVDFGDEGINVWLDAGTWGPYRGVPGTLIMWGRAGSMHPGGHHAMMADGSIHFLNEYTNLTVLQLLSTMADGQAIAVPDFLGKSVHANRPPSPRLVGVAHRLCRLRRRFQPVGVGAGKRHRHPRRQTVFRCAHGVHFRRLHAGTGRQRLHRQRRQVELESTRGRKRAPLGEYRVAMSKQVMPDGSDFPADAKVPPIKSRAKQVLPGKYSRRGTVLKATVHSAPTWSISRSLRTMARRRLAAGQDNAVKWP